MFSVSKQGGRHRPVLVQEFPRCAINPVVRRVSGASCSGCGGHQGVPVADAMMLDTTMDLFNTEDCTRRFVNTAKAFDRDIEPPDTI